MKSSFAKQNMNMLNTSFGYRICSPLTLFGIYENECAMPFLDIFHVVEDPKSGKIEFASEDTRWKYWDECFYSEEVFPLHKQASFGPVVVNIPHDALSYLKRTYGEDCLEAA